MRHVHHEAIEQRADIVRELARRADDLKRDRVAERCDHDAGLPGQHVLRVATQPRLQCAPL